MSPYGGAYFVEYDFERCDDRSMMCTVYLEPEGHVVLVSEAPTGYRDEVTALPRVSRELREKVNGMFRKWVEYEADLTDVQREETMIAIEHPTS
jgi:hypothetical protein